MSCMQEPEVVNKDKAEINEKIIMEEITKSSNPQSKDRIKAKILNSTLGANVELLKRHDWSGSVLGTYPPTINRDYYGGFTHQGIPPNDSKGAVVYVGSNIKDGPDNCAWLLAWHVPTDPTSNNKIYVEAGALSQYSGDINWEDIESKLDTSSNESYYLDENTKSQASAQIGDGNITAASVVFDVVNVSVT